MPLELDFNLTGDLVAILPPKSAGGPRVTVKLSPEGDKALAQILVILAGQRDGLGHAHYNRVGHASAPTQYQLDKIQRHDGRGRPILTLAQLGLT